MILTPFIEGVEQKKQLCDLQELEKHPDEEIMSLLTCY